MSEYLVKIDVQHALDQINLQVSDEEATGSEFLKSSISSHEGRVTNLATFKRRSDAVPYAIKLLEHDAKPPEGMELVWSGAMVVKGANTTVSAYRET